MKKTVRRRTEITIETHEIRIVRGGSVSENPGQVLSTEAGDPALHIRAEEALNAFEDQLDLSNPDPNPSSDE